MAPYFGLYLLITLLSYFQLKHEKFRSPIEYLTMTIFFVFLGFRFRVGGDWEGYFNLLTDYANNKHEGASEPFFILMMNASLLFPTKYQYTALNGFFALALISCLFFVTRKFSERKLTITQLVWLFFPIFIFLFGTGYLRQSIACVLIMPILYYTKAQNYKLSWLFVALAICFHKSSAIFSLIPFLWFLKSQKGVVIYKISDWNKKYAFLLMLIVFTLFACIFIWGKSYVDQSMHSYGILVRVFYLIILAFPVLKSHEAQIIKFYRNFPYFVMFLASLSLLLTIYFSTFIDRFLFYLFIPLAWFSLLKIYNEFEVQNTVNRLNRFYLFVLIMMNTSYMYIWLKYSYWGTLKWVPYQNILSF